MWVRDRVFVRAESGVDWVGVGDDLGMAMGLFWRLC